MTASKQSQDGTGVGPTSATFRHVSVGLTTIIFRADNTTDRTHGYWNVSVMSRTSLIDTLAYQNSIHEEIKSRLKSGNACYLSVWNILCYILVYKYIKIKIYRTVMLPVVLYGCETWWLTLGEERRLRVFENRELRRIFGAKRDEITREWRTLHNEELNDLY